MGPEPVAAPPQQLVHLVGTDPVVLGVVEHREQHVAVLQRGTHGVPAGQPSRCATAVSPSREPGIERDGSALHVVAQRIEQPSQNRRPAPQRNDRKVDLEIEGLRNQIRAVLAPAVQCRAIQPAQRDAQDRGRHVRPIAQVGLETSGPALSAVPCRADGIDLDIGRRRAALLSGLRVEDMGAPEPDIDRAHPIRVLVQQVPQIGGGGRRRGQ